MINTRNTETFGIGRGGKEEKRGEGNLDEKRNNLNSAEKVRYGYRRYGRAVDSRRLTLGESFQKRREG